MMDSRVWTDEEWQRRLAATLAAATARRQARAQLRAQLAERRRHGLAARHARKAYLARHRRLPRRP